jgi:hypothetical protein
MNRKLFPIFLLVVLSTEVCLAACRALVAGLFCDDDGLHLKSERAQAYREHACTIRQR